MLFFAVAPQASTSRAAGSNVLEEVSLLTPRYKLEAHQNYILKNVFSPDSRLLPPLL